MNLKSGTWLPAIVLAAALASATSCSSGGDNGPTGPGGGGGGGGGGLEMNSGDIGFHGTYQHRFFTAGTFNYHCVHHSPMTGTVTVNDAATDTVVNVSIVSSTTPFPGATVKTGGRVVWTNNNTMVHTVTSN